MASPMNSCLSNDAGSNSLKTVLAFSEVQKEKHFFLIFAMGNTVLIFSERQKGAN